MPTPRIEVSALCLIDEGYTMTAQLNHGLYRVAGSALRAGPGEIFISLQDITRHCP